MRSLPPVGLVSQSVPVPSVSAADVPVLIGPYVQDVRDASGTNERRYGTLGVEDSGLEALGTRNGRAVHAVCGGDNAGWEFELDFSGCTSEASSISTAC